MNRIERISAMEALLDETSAAVMAMEKTLEDYSRLQVKFTRLSRYYGSQTWHGDMNADRAGRLPETLRRGVLSEDLIYDALTANRENALRMLEIATDILRAE